MTGAPTGALWHSWPRLPKAADVAAVVGRETTLLAPTRSELINVGLLCTPVHGFAGFTVPHCDDFMLQTVPVPEVPGAKRPHKTQERRVVEIGLTHDPTDTPHAWRCGWAARPARMCGLLAQQCVSARLQGCWRVPPNTRFVLSGCPHFPSSCYPSQPERPIPCAVWVPAQRTRRQTCSQHQFVTE